MKKDKEPVHVHSQEVVLLKRNEQGRVVLNDEGLLLQAKAHQDGPGQKQRLESFKLTVDRQEQAVKDGTLRLEDYQA